MDQDSRSSFADDPDFLASLPELDAGLADNDAEVRRKTQPALPPPEEARQPVPPARPAPPPQVRATSRTAPILPLPPVTLPEVQPPPPGGRRRLLDLFPPPPGGVSEAPSLPVGISPPPRIEFRGTVMRAVEPEERPPSMPPVPLTYETFYGLSEKAFGLSTDPKFLYHSSAHDQAAQQLLSAIRRRDGLVVLTGDIGMGKTMLCRAVTEELDRRTLTSLVVDPFVSFEQLLQTVLVDFGVVSRDDVARGRLAQASSRDLVTKLREFIASLVQLQAFAVVIIDEAQTLPAAVLEEIRGIMDADAQQRLLQVVLVGQPSLLKLLGRPELKELKQRIAVRSDLKALLPDEIASYVMHRIAVAGPQARVEFDEAAYTRLHHVTSGVPRLVNLVCDRALTLGQKASASVIDESIVHIASEDLDIVPLEPRQARVVRGVVTGLIFAALVAAGAAAAALVFRDPLMRMLAQWGFRI